MVTEKLQKLCFFRKPRASCFPRHFLNRWMSVLLSKNQSFCWRTPKFSFSLNAQLWCTKNLRTTKPLSNILLYLARIRVIALITVNFHALHTIQFQGNTRSLASREINWNLVQLPRLSPSEPDVGMGKRLGHGLGKLLTCSCKYYTKSHYNHK